MKEERGREGGGRGVLGEKEGLMLRYMLICTR